MPVNFLRVLKSEFEHIHKYLLLGVNIPSKNFQFPNLVPVVSRSKGWEEERVWEQG